MKESVNKALRETAETIGLEALTFLLAEPRQRDRFLAETGFEPADLVGNADAAHVLGAVLSRLMEDEALLLSFAANQGLAPKDVMKAHEFFATDGGRTRPLGSA